MIRKDIDKEIINYNCFFFSFFSKFRHFSITIVFYTYIMKGGMSIRIEKNYERRDASDHKIDWVRL